MRASLAFLCNPGLRGIIASRLHTPITTSSTQFNPPLHHRSYLHLHNHNHNHTADHKLIMGLFGSSTPAGLPPQKIAPNRTQRAACWEARDGFFACLDANNIIDAIKEAPKAKSACGAQEVAFERDCVGSWVCPDSTESGRGGGGC